MNTRSCHSNICSYTISNSYVEYACEMAIILYANLIAKIINTKLSSLMYVANYTAQIVAL